MPAPLIAAAARTVGTRKAVGYTGSRLGVRGASRRAVEEETQGRKRQATTAVENLFKEKGEELGEGDLQQALADPPSAPHFPLFIGALAAMKDILDPLDLTGIGMLVTPMGTFFAGLVIMFWMLGKMSGGWWKKGMIKWFWKRFLLVFMIEMFPFLKIVPATTILVLMAHYKEAKIVKLLNGGLEILHNHGFKKG